MSLKLPRVVIVEDVPALAESYAAFLADEGVTVDVTLDGRAALASIERTPVAVAIVDINLPDMSGLDILQHIKKMGSPTDVVIITAEGSVKVAVEAMRHGAFDFIMKPFNRDRLRVTVRNALEHRRLSDRLAEAAEEANDGSVGRFVGQSLPMQAVYRILKSAGPTNATVFVTGESGTGKELCADALHQLSKRRGGPFVTVNCAAIPKDLLESEIFGHVKGSFTAARADTLSDARSIAHQLRGLFAQFGARQAALAAAGVEAADAGDLPRRIETLREAATLAIAALEKVGHDAAKSF